MNTNARHVLPAVATEEPVQTPLRVTPMHICDRETSKVAGAPRAWRQMGVIELAYRQGRLGPVDSDAARARLSAGEQFTRIWDSAQAATRDSTGAFDFCGGGQGVPITEALRAAISRVSAIEGHLGARDKIIVRAICAWGHTPAEAIELARLPPDTRVTARLCEAMDALADALERTHRRRNSSPDRCD